MEEIDIKDLFYYFKSKIIFITITILIILIGGMAYKFIFEPAIYESSTSLILTGFSDTKDDDSTINNNDLTINSKLLTTYQQITKSRKVLLQVIDTLKLDYDADTLAENINVSGIPDTEIIVITVSDRDPNLAYKIVTEIAQIFTKEVQDIYNVSNVSMLDAPTIATAPSNKNIIKSLGIFLGIGLVLAFSLTFIMYYFDTTIKTTEQLEAKIDVPVLGSIPNYNQNKKRGKK